jgi:hypothetical protein
LLSCLQPALAAAQYDPFRRQKEAALIASARSLVEVGAAVLALVTACDQQQQQQQQQQDEEMACTQFVEALQVRAGGGRGDGGRWMGPNSTARAQQQQQQQQQEEEKAAYTQFVDALQVQTGGCMP